MKAINVAAVLATASAVAPPRIELDLSALPAAGLLSAPVTLTHDLSYTQPDGSAVGSRQDYVERCPAGSSNHISCPFPNAAAYDHQDKAVSVTTRVKIVDEDGTSKNLDVNNVNFAVRSTYLFHYDAHDAVGNRAEQVVFMLILDDKTPPQINMCGGTAEAVEAASVWTVCSTSTATDNIDPTTSTAAPTISYEVNATATGTVSNYATYDANMLPTTTVGDYEVTLCTHDHAGAYGIDGADNTYCVMKAVVISDTLPPLISIHGDQPLSHECATTFVDGDASASDQLDGDFTLCRDQSGYVSGDVGCVLDTNNVDIATPGPYWVKYDTEDANGNEAVQKTRTVHVKDDIKPVVCCDDAKTICSSADDTEPLQCPAAPQHKSGRTFSDEGVECEDTCDKSLAAVTMEWNRPWNDKVTGDYIRTYSCVDAAGNRQNATRQFTVIDDSQPIITIMGDETETYEATHDTEYTDKGATCHDYVDGVLSHAVEVSGQIVKLNIPATYVIRYDCQDLSGNTAEPMNRTVVVVDTTCPRLSLIGDELINIEAGFPYLDAGVTGTDDLDGTIFQCADGTSASDCWWTDGNTVAFSDAFYSRRSCREIKDSMTNAGLTAVDGEYMITTYLETGATFERTHVWCDMAGNGNTYYAVTDSGDAVIPYVTSGSQGKCGDYGLKMALFEDTATRCRAVAKFKDSDSDTGCNAASKYFPVGTNVATDSYLCSTNDASDVAADPDHFEWTNGNKTKLIQNHPPAQVGTYVILYHAQDSHGNTETGCGAACVKRTVTVGDTLPPVISLHLKGKGTSPIHVSKHDQVGIGGQLNPAGSPVHNPFLHASYNPFMAESAQASSVNGWVIGAVASAVSGVALLASSLRRKANAEVSVPV